MIATSKKNTKTFAADKKGITAAERRFRNAVNSIRGAGRSSMTKEVQVDVAHLINEVERYGFNFFPNHYVFGQILELEKIAESAVQQSVRG